MDASQAQYLSEQGFSSGLVVALQKEKVNFPVRIWLLDNGIAMAVKDAHILRGNYQNIDATRWEELQDCVAYHAHMAKCFGLPTRFALLNTPSTGPQYFALNQSGNLDEEFRVLHHVMTITKPNGPTPLTKQLQILREYIVSVTAHLRGHRQTASVILATQGLPTDDLGQHSPGVLQNFVQILQSFEGLPVWFVIRLCTDDVRAINFYNSLHSQINLSYDVLDDFYGEALEIYLRNPWLTYGLPLHRFREMGFRIHVLDTLDERALTRLELRDLFYLLFATINPLPDPEKDWNGFFIALKVLMAKEKMQWNPVTKTVAPWVNLDQLNAFYTRRTPAPKPVYQTKPPPPQAKKTTPQNQTQENILLPTGDNEKESSLDTAQLKKSVCTVWARKPPSYSSIKPLPELLGGIHLTFCLVEIHPYFEEKYHPFSSEALLSGDKNVLKRGRSYVI